MIIPQNLLIYRHHGQSMRRPRGWGIRFVVALSESEMCRADAGFAILFAFARRTLFMTAIAYDTIKPPFTTLKFQEMPEEAAAGLCSMVSGNHTRTDRRAYTSGQIVRRVRALDA